VIIQFDYLKKVILKSPEYWQTKNGGSLSAGGHLGSAGVSEIVSTVFTFKDFFKAFKVKNCSSKV
jgi:hypothetical protein